ncbi:ornithine carbamoyltransferase [Desmospora profundinema]|uniref:Ornithine carbamoyltransferase n=1 Tax=Desmospora profundinema TaxID=1571184 RepID=A0ABU1ILC8_9BACL|nr:ornithine carbamoyltransferase [Desmospora profundinema]MDR6225585.1 ornithine carbamoyltransferase [Desmospora profundinema]
MSASLTTMPIPPALAGRDFLAVSDTSAEEIRDLIRHALWLKEQKKAGHAYRPLAGKSLAMIFDKPSTRTRTSFEAGMAQLGGHPLSLNRQELQLGRGESVEDTARILSGYVDAVLIRTFQHDTVQKLAENASIPVINGLTDSHHPCQALADLMTVIECKPEQDSVRLAYVGDGNNVLHSLAEAAALTGWELVAATPPGYEPDPVIWQQAADIALVNGGRLHLVQDPKEAVAQADAVYTDVWASMGQEEEKEQRLRDFTGFQVDASLMQLAQPDAVFLHCLPAYRGLEVTAEVMEGPQSEVFRQAENRLHAQKALLTSLLSDG